MTPHAPAITTTRLDPVHWPAPRIGVIDRALAAIGAGRLAMRRVTARYGFDLYRAYLEAAKSDRVTGNWKKIDTDANTVVGADAKTSRARARWLVQNNPYAVRAKQAIVDNAISTGIVTQCKVEYSRDPTENETLNTRLESRKARWAEQADANGILHWSEMERLILGQVIETGAILVRRRFLATPGRVLPLAFELIEADRLTDYGATPAAGNEVVGGVEVPKDTAGPAVAYHIDDGSYAYKVVRIPAGDIRHIYRVDRPGQLGGLTWFAPVLPDLYMLADIKEYALIARKVQSAIAVLVADDPKTGGLGGLPGLNPLSSAATSNTPGDPIRFLEPGMIHRVGAGQVTPFTPSQAQDLDPLTKLVLRGIGVGFGISYEWISGDYKEVSFAGGRMSGQDSWQSIEPVHGFIEHRCAAPVHRDWVDAELTFGTSRRPPAKADPYAVRFAKPRRGWGVNPLQEVNAAVKAIDGGISTIRDEVEARGGDWEDFLKQIAREISFGDSLNLTLHKALRALAPEPDADSAANAGDDANA